MTFSTSFAAITGAERYKLLCATIVPRPIALVTSCNAEGLVNAAPFSFFNVFSEDPALIILGLQHKPRPTGKDTTRKDTTRNIAETGCFVVNLVDEPMAEAMNVCAADLPSDVSEIAVAGLSLTPGVDIPVPHITQAPFALECRRTMALAFGNDRELLIGEVVRLHAREGLVDPATLRIDAGAYQPIGRMFADGYVRLNDRFDLKRPALEALLKAAGA